MTMRYLFVCSPSHLLKFNWIAKQTLVSFMPFIQFHRRFHLYLSIFYLTFFYLVCFTLSAPFHHIFNFNLTMHLAGKIYIQIQISSFFHHSTCNWLMARVFISTHCTFFFVSPFRFNGSVFALHLFDPHQLFTFSLRLSFCIIHSGQVQAASVNRFARAWAHLPLTLSDWAIQCAFIVVVVVVSRLLLLLLLHLHSLDILPVRKSHKRNDTTN